MQKNTLLFICLFFISNILLAQVEYNMQNLTVTDCEGILYDSGGPDGDYGNGEEFTFTICPEPMPSCIRLDLGAVTIENHFETLRVYDGASINGTILLNHNSGLETLPTLQAYSGCMTIQFISDNLTQFHGWKAKWQCFDDDCPPYISAPGVQDCLGAIPICQNVYISTSAYIGEGNVSNEINENTSCLLQGERNSVWYKLKIKEIGELAFLIIPNNLDDDYDFAVFNLTDSECGETFNDSSLLVSCNYSSNPGITGTSGATEQTSGSSIDSNQNAIIPVQKGETYFINISQFSPSLNGYKVDFSLSNVLISDNTPPMIDNPNALIQVVSATEVQFYFSEDIQCPSMENMSLQLEEYTFTYNTFCNELSYSSTFTFDVTPPLEAGSYALNMSGELADFCGNTTAIDENIAFEVDEIVGLPPIHKSDIQLYPNPTSDILFLQLPDGIFSSNRKAQLELFDLQGQRVGGQLLEGETSNEINVKDYPRGIYFVKVQIGEKIWGEKVLLK